MYTSSYIELQSHECLMLNNMVMCGKYKYMLHGYILAMPILTFMREYNDCIKLNDLSK